MTHRLRYACQTYSWQMSIDTYRGRADHMIGVAAEAGFAGFEPELVMLGDGWSTAELTAHLQRHGVELAALVLAEPWRDLHETDDEKDHASQAIEATSRLGAKLVLVPLPGIDRSDARERQRSSMACMGAVAERAAGAGVECTFHPNSPAGSAFRTAADYDVMADLLPDGIGYTPDIGHIAKGGMDPLSVIRTWRSRVDHVHVKDIDASGRWAETGQGVIDIEGVLGYLEETRFPGWVTFEDESPAAKADPDRATILNGRWIQRRETRK